MTSLRQQLVEWWRDNHGGWCADDSESLFILGDDEGDPLDAAIVGITDGNVLIYNAPKAIEILHETLGGEWDEAMDHFFYNVVGSCTAPNAPLFMWPFEPEASSEAEATESDTSAETVLA
jgi:hypothetical protein